MLDLDITVFYTIIILWTLLIVLNRIFFKPVSRVIDEREKKAETEKSEIERMKVEIDERSGKIESVLKKARKDAVTVSEDLIREGESSREALISSTRAKTHEEFRNRMASLDMEIEAAELKLKGEIRDFSSKIEEIFT